MFSIFEIGNVDEQIEKVIEEAVEIKDAFDNESNLDRTLEECCDNIQATINLMHMLTDKNGMVEAIRKHHMKMIKRNYEQKGEVLICIFINERGDL